MARSVNDVIPVSIVLDSGIFLNDVPSRQTRSIDAVSKAEGPAEVGFFLPTVFVFGDEGRLLEVQDLCLERSANRAIEIRHIGQNGPINPGVKYTSKLREYLLRIHDLYPKGSPKAVSARFDWIVSFQSGSCRPSNIKMRIFKEINGYTHQPTGKTQNLGLSAHDVVLELDLQPGQHLDLAIDGKPIWTSRDNKDQRFDLEIISPHTSAENYFRDALDHEGKDYWVPNQGDPQPMGGP